MRGTFLEIQECAELARKVIDATFAIYPTIFFDELILNEFDELVKGCIGLNMSADSRTDNYEDCTWVLKEAHRYSGVIKDYFSDAHHNGRPTRWLKISDHIAIQGKTRSAFAIRNSTYDHRGERRIRRIDCELHQEAREAEITCSVIPFSLDADGAEGIKGWCIRGDSCKDDNNLCAFVFPALEVLGFKTPPLYSWSGVRNVCVKDGS